MKTEKHMYYDFKRDWLNSETTIDCYFHKAEIVKESDGIYANAILGIQGYNFVRWHNMQHEHGGMDKECILRSLQDQIDKMMFYSDNLLTASMEASCDWSDDVRLEFNFHNALNVSTGGIKIISYKPNEFFKDGRIALDLADCANKTTINCKDVHQLTGLMLKLSRAMLDHIKQIEEMVKFIKENM